MTYAPIVLFAFKRIENLKQCVSSLKRNSLCNESDLIIFSDAARSEDDIDKVNQVRDYIKTISGFKTITIFYAKENLGLARSIINGVTDVINKYGKVIVIEDDLIVAKNFLTYMNLALEYYETFENVLSISGYSFLMKIPKDYSFDNYFTQRVFSWGWGTWKDKWVGIDWEVKDYKHFKEDKSKHHCFNSMGTDLMRMLDKQMNGEINSWAIRWYYHQFKYQLFTVFPVYSKVINNGFNLDATHSGLHKRRFWTELTEEDQQAFNFSNNVKLEKYIITQFTSHFSIPTRAYYKIVDSVNKMVSFFS